MPRPGAHRIQSIFQANGLGGDAKALGVQRGQKLFRLAVIGGGIQGGDAVITAMARMAAASSGGTRPRVLDTP